MFAFIPAGHLIAQLLAAVGDLGQLERERREQRQKEDVEEDVEVEDGARYEAPLDVEEGARHRVLQQILLATRRDQHERMLGDRLQRRVEDAEVDVGVARELVVPHALVQNDLEHLPHLGLGQRHQLRVLGPRLRLRLRLGQQFDVGLGLGCFVRAVDAAGLSNTSI